MRQPPPNQQVVAVQDEKTEVQQLLREALEADGYTVHVHGDWRTAFQFVVDLQPDLVITELLFAGQLYGRELIAQLAADPRTGMIPIVVCSDFLDAVPGLTRLLAEVGVACVTKPFDLDLLLATVRAALRTRG